MIKGVAHICIGALDLDATFRFWTEVLGMKRQFSFNKNGAIVGHYLDAGRGSFVEMFRQDAADAAARQMIRHVCLEVDDMDATIADIRAKGWKVSEKSLGCDRSWQAWLEDPSGVRIELHQYTAESSQVTCRDCTLPSK